MTEKIKYKRVLGDWVLGKTLGQGSMGKVKLAFNSKSSEKLACKIIHRPADAPDLPKGVTLIGPTEELKNVIIDGQTRKPIKTQKEVFDNSRILREIGISLLVDHDNIVKLKFLYMDEENYYLFFEYVDGGQILDFIISHGALNERLSRKFLWQILDAVDYCHSNAIVHRDLKIENILMDKKGNVKLIDFGLANFINPFQRLATFCGSLYFAAPEVLSAKKYIGPEVDMWSIGVILYVLVTGKVPFDDSTLPALHRKIKAGIYDSPRGVTEECDHLISRLLVVNPRERASMDEIKKHPWLTKRNQKPPGANAAMYPAIKLPLNSKVIKRMDGLGFGTESEITKSLETYLKDSRSQGTQKWSIGGRTINCPESPLFSIYKLTLIKFGKLQPFETEKKSSNRIALSKISVKTGEKDMQKKSVWNLFGKNRVGNEENMESVNGVKKKGFMSRLYRSKNDQLEDNLSSSTNETLDDGENTPRQSIDLSRDSIDVPRESLDISREGSTKMKAKSFDLRRDSPNSSGERRSFFSKLRSNTQMNLKPTAEKPSRMSRLVSPSIAAIKSFSSRIFSKKEETIPSQDSPGASTLEIKTSYLSGIFTIRNTTNLPVVEIREELVKAFARVPNLQVIEQKGYFFCKFYDSVPTEEGANDDSHSKIANNGSSTPMVTHLKPKALFEVFIRKIPFSSLHGIQFYKISGDAYKVLKENLNL